MYITNYLSHLSAFSYLDSVRRGLTRVRTRDRRFSQSPSERTSHGPTSVRTRSHESGGLPNGTTHCSRTRCLVRILGRVVSDNRSRSDGHGRVGIPTLPDGLSSPVTPPPLPDRVMTPSTFVVCSDTCVGPTFGHLGHVSCVRVYYNKRT